jgi:hypothetical protein
MWRRPCLTILILVVSFVSTLPLKAQQKLISQDQISKMVQAGLGDDSGSKLIEQRGIDFAVAGFFLWEGKR